MSEGVQTKITFFAEGENEDEAVESLEFDINEMLRRCGDGGEADWEDYLTFEPCEIED